MTGPMEPTGPTSPGRPAAPRPRRFRLVAHLLPTLLVLLGLGLLFAVMSLVFSAVFFVDDAADVNLRDAVSTGVFIIGMVLGVTMAAFVVGVVLDLATMRAPWFVRVPAVLVVPALGAVLVALDLTVGFYLLEFSLVLCGYWAVLVVQEPTMRGVRWLLGRLRGPSGPTAGPTAGPAGGPPAPPNPPRR